ncbi:melatonin receptor type 1A-like isoform X1 [Clavelina lepadiformis]|uniref:melatonin receptor type 1A-like isoform X1 n=1 Tax=Clavelina lepadiformis TaxID=159417 RepID=UPI004041CA28
MNSLVQSNNFVLIDITSQPLHVTYMDNLQAEDQHIGKVISLCVLMVMGIIGNMLVIAAVMQERKLNLPGNYFIINLAIADLLISAASMPIILDNLIRDRFYPIEVMHHSHKFSCQFSAYLKAITIHATWFSLAFIAVNRYYCVCKSAAYTRYFTKRNVITTVILIWVWVLIINFPIMIGWSIRNSSKNDQGNSGDGYYPLYPKGHPPVIYDVNSHDCMLGIAAQHGYTFSNGLYAMVIPLMIIASSYILLFINIIKSRRKIQISIGSKQLKKRYKKEKRTFIMLVTIVVTFLICWLPQIIDDLQPKVMNKNTTIEAKQLAINWLALSNSVMNPFLYALLNNAFRQGYKNILISVFTWVGKCPTRKKHTNEIYVST